MKIAAILFAVLLCASACAGTSASANYSTTTDVIDSGGGRTASAQYANDSSMGSPGAVTTVGTYSARGGFPGQLYEVTSAIDLVAPFASVGEQVGMGLSARIICSDGTRLALLGTNVTWSTSGPLFITVGGAAVGQPVYQDTPAIATATYGTGTANLSLTIIDDAPDNYGIYAADGLPDSWQVTYFGVNNPMAAPAVDADKDDQSNRLEYLATTIPTNPESRLRLRIEAVPDKENWRALKFSPYDKKRTYTLHANGNLADADGWASVTPLDFGEANGEGYFIDETSELLKFYRIEILP